MSKSAEPTIAQSVFEGLFARVLKPTGAFREDLRGVGYDMDRQEPSYPLVVWASALRVAVRHEYPNKPPEEGLRLLGSRFLDGFFETIAGRLVAISLPLLGPDGVMKRIPRFWGSGAPGTEINSIHEGPGKWQLRVRHPSPQPEFDSGMIQSGLRRLGVVPEIAFLERTPTSYVMQVQWSSARP